jgi:hypothetical protein
MLFNIHDLFYSQYSHKHVSATVASIFRVILIQEYVYTNVVSCVAVTPLQLTNYCNFI